MSDIWDDLTRKNQVEHDRLKEVADDHLDRINRAIAQVADLWRRDHEMGKDERTRPDWVRRFVYIVFVAVLVLVAVSIGVLVSHLYWPTAEVVPSGTVYSWIEINGAQVPEEESLP